MSNLDAVKKVLMYQKDKSGFVKEPTVKEMADLVVLVLNSVKTIEQAIESKRLDIDKKYATPVEQSLQKIKSDNASLLTQVTRDINSLLEKGDVILSQTKSELETQIQQAIANIRNGEDGIVTEAEIQKAAEIALGMLELPDFDALVSETITANPAAIRDSLELLSGEERYKVEIADVQGLTDALTRLSQVRNSQGGTIGKNQVYNFIREAIADGTITSGGSVSDTAYAGSWNGVTDVAPSKNAVYDKIESLVLGAGTGDVVGPASAVNNNFAAFDLTTGKLIKDSGVSGASFAAALGADDNYVTDAEKAALHTHSNKVVLDATTASFLIADESKLDGIEALADVTDATNVAAAGAFMKSVDDTDDITVGTVNKFATAAEKTKLGHISVTQPVDLDTMESDIAGKQAGDADLTAIAALSTAGIAVRTGAGTWAIRDMTYPAAGLTITNSAGVAGNPAFALANDLAALEALSSTGIPKRTGADTWSQVAAPTGDILGTSDVQTVTNKRVQPRVYSAANNASLTPEKDTYDIFHLTAMSANTTINNPSTTTPTDGEKMQFRFLDNGTARTLTWGTAYVAKGGIALPSTTVLSKNLSLGFEYNSNLSKWNLLASAQEA